MRCRRHQKWQVHCCWRHQHGSRAVCPEEQTAAQHAHLHADQPSGVKCTTSACKEAIQCLQEKSLRNILLTYADIGVSGSSGGCQAATSSLVIQRLHMLADTCMAAESNSGSSSNLEECSMFAPFKSTLAPSMHKGASGVDVLPAILHLHNLVAGLRHWGLSTTTPVVHYLAAARWRSPCC